MKSLKEIRSQLMQPGFNISDLKARELRPYFDYRIDNLISLRGVLLRRELEYLLGETGNGSMRFDIDLINEMADDELILQGYEPAKDLEFIIDSKRKINTTINEANRSKTLQESTKVMLEQIFGGLELKSEYPITLEGSIKDRKIIIYWLNDEWLMPDKNFLSYMDYAYKNNRYPIFIAKKIQGILFPFFKATGAVGINTYRTLTTPESADIFNNINEQIKAIDGRPYEPHFLRFYAQISTLESLLNNPDEPVVKFLRDYVPTYISSSIFLDHKVNYRGSFGLAINSLKFSAAKKNLLKWQRKRTLLTAGLKRVTKTE